MKDISQKHHLDTDQYLSMYELSINKPDEFWSEQAKKFITWFSPWKKTIAGDFSQQPIQWFTQGKLNACYNCIDRHLTTRADQIAIIWEGNTPGESLSLTYTELHKKICQFSNVLKTHGIQKGDRVCIYLPMIPEAVIAMLACARIGAIHSVVFGGFSAEALQTRILDADCRLLITVDESMRGEKAIPFKENVDIALLNCPRVSTVIIIQRTGKPISINPKRDVWYHEAMQTAETTCLIEHMDANEPLFILYTSGSTGKPKGIVHSTGGYLVYTAMTFHYVFDHHPQDIFWCTADIGWITGHSYLVYGPLVNGATTLIFEGVPNYPDYSRYWNVIDKHQVNIFYTAPTALRALRREGDTWVTRTHRNSLKLLGSVGEPINPDVWEWYYQVVGERRCPIVNTWWQTETGGILLTPLPGAVPSIAGSAGVPFFGILPDIINKTSPSLTKEQQGKLIIKKPWPGLMQTIYGDQTRFINTYFKDSPGNYLTGDSAYQDNAGFFWITGRDDDVIKVSGHRIGTEELESAFISHPAVAEAAVVGIPHEIKGESIFAFITLNHSEKPTPALKNTLKQHIRNKIGPLATPDNIQWTSALPKTRSGKIMRRILRKIANNDTENLGDMSTLADADVISVLIKETGNAS